MEEDTGFVKSTRTMGNKKKRQLAIIITLGVIDFLLVVLIAYFLTNPDAIRGLKSSMGMLSKDEEAKKADSKDGAKKVENPNGKVKSLGLHSDGAEVRLNTMIEEDEMSKKKILDGVKTLEGLEKRIRLAKTVKEGDKVAVEIAKFRKDLELEDFEIAKEETEVDDDVIFYTKKIKSSERDADSPATVSSPRLSGKSVHDFVDTLAKEFNEAGSSRKSADEFKLSSAKEGSKEEEEKMTIAQRKNYLGDVYELKEELNRRATWYSAKITAYKVRIEDLEEIRKILQHNKKSINKEDSKLDRSFREEILGKEKPRISSNEVFTVGEEGSETYIALRATKFEGVQAAA